MTQSSLARWAILVTATTALAGCGGVSSWLGLERHVPDESQVVVRPALTLPPDYDLMPPGTATPVSSDHENGLAKGGQPVDANASSQPKKEERGFFSSMVHGFGLFDSDDSSDVVKPLPKDYNPNADINGIPQAPPPSAVPNPAPASTTPSDPGPDIQGTPQAPQKTSSATFHREMPLAMALMVDPNAGSSDATGKSPNYVADFFSDMGSLVGIQPDKPKHYYGDGETVTPAPSAAPAPVAAAPVQPVSAIMTATPTPAVMAVTETTAPAQAAPVHGSKHPDYIHDFFSDMGSLVGLGDDTKKGGADPAAK